MHHDTSRPPRTSVESRPVQALPERDTWDVAQVCVRGHLITDQARGRPTGQADECPTCGHETIAACPGCREPIAGARYERGTGRAMGMVAPPRYCTACGRPFPWTERVMSAVRVVIREITALNRHERDQLRRCIEHIIHVTPQTAQAVRHINASLARIGGEQALALRELFLSIASAEIRPQLGGAAQ